MAKQRESADSAATGDQEPTVAAKEPATEERLQVMAAYIRTLKAVMKAIRNKLHF